MRGITLLIVIISLLALAGYILRPTSKVTSNTLYTLAVIFTVLLVLGFSRLS
jgi:hypothetical protein